MRSRHTCAIAARCPPQLNVGGGEIRSHAPAVLTCNTATLDVE